MPLNPEHGCALIAVNSRKNGRRPTTAGRSTDWYSPPRWDRPWNRGTATGSGTHAGGCRAPLASAARPAAVMEALGHSKISLTVNPYARLKPAGCGLWQRFFTGLSGCAGGPPMAPGHGSSRHEADVTTPNRPYQTISNTLLDIPDLPRSEGTFAFPARPSPALAEGPRLVNGDEWIDIRTGRLDRPRPHRQHGLPEANGRSFSGSRATR